MDVGFSIHQISGPPVADGLVNQRRNVGGSARGFVADIESCNGKGVLLTTMTEPTLEALNARLETLLRRFDEA